MKRVLLLLASFGLVSSLQAQSLESLRFSVEAGASYTTHQDNFVGPAAPRDHGQPSFLLGAEAAIPLGYGMWGEAEVRYARTSHKVISNFAGIEGPETRVVDKLGSEHLLMPLGLRYQLLGSPVYVSAHAGPNVELAARHYRFIDYADPDRTNKRERRPQDVARLNAVFSGGVGTFLSAFGQQLRVEARYAHLTRRYPRNHIREISLNAAYVF